MKGVASQDECFEVNRISRLLPVQCNRHFCTRDITPTSGVHQVLIRCTSGAHQVHIRCTSGVHQVLIRCTSGVLSK